MDLQGNHMGVLEFVSGHGLDVFPISLGSGFGICHHERQLKYFDARKASCRAAWQGPNHIDHTVAHLVVQLHRCAAQLHGGIGFELDATARVFFDLVHPCFVHVEPHIGHWSHEGMKLQGDGLLGLAVEDRCDQSSSSACFE